MEYKLYQKVLKKQHNIFPVKLKIIKKFVLLVLQQVDMRLYYMVLLLNIDYVLALNLKLI